MNNSGKVLTVFLIIIFVLMFSLAAISIFLYQKEMELRKTAEVSLEQVKMSEAKLQADFKESQKQLHLLEAKNKESNEKIDSLMDELELEKGLREEVKEENNTLKDALNKESQEKNQVKEQLTKQLKESEQKVADLEQKFQAEIQRSSELEKKNQESEKFSKELQEKIQNSQATGIGESAPPGTAKNQQEVQLDKIVVTPEANQGNMEGRVLTVDKDAEFIIFNLGQQDGVTEGDVMSIYRADQYLGDVKVSRVQPEMAAADFVPPLTSQTVQKDDRVFHKK